MLSLLDDLQVKPEKLVLRYLRHSAPNIVELVAFDFDKIKTLHLHAVELHGEFWSAGFSIDYLERLYLRDVHGAIFI